jgi:hypothetical protein
VEQIVIIGRKKFHVCKKSFHSKTEQSLVFAEQISWNKKYTLRGTKLVSADPIMNSYQTNWNNILVSEEHFFLEKKVQNI